MISALFKAFSQFGDPRIRRVVWLSAGLAIAMMAALAVGLWFAVGWLAGLNIVQMVDAIGITVGGNTATRQGRADRLSNWKAFAAADACRRRAFQNPATPKEQAPFEE